MTTATDIQRRVQALLDEMTVSGAERGPRVATYHDGKLVADAWSGRADPATGGAPAATHHTRAR